MIQLDSQQMQALFQLASYIAIIVFLIVMISLLLPMVNAHSSYSSLAEGDKEVTIVVGEEELVSCYQDSYKNKSSTIKCSTTYMTHKQAEKAIDKIPELLEK